MSSFYACRSQKHKKDSQIKQLFALSGPAQVKAVPKHVDEMDPISHFFQFYFSELQPNFCSNLSLPRRHSMISIGIGEATSGGALNANQPTAKEEKKVSKSAWGKVGHLFLIESRQTKMIYRHPSIMTFIDNYGFDSSHSIKGTFFILYFWICITKFCYSHWKLHWRKPLRIAKENFTVSGNA